jgi:DNA-binding transcriptional ArsR family regulator
MVNTYKLKLTNLQQEILRLLFKKVGKSLNARNIALALNVSQPAVSKSLPFLKEKELITIIKDKESKRLSIELNREDPEIIGLKRADNLKQLYEVGLVRFLYDSLPGSTILLFGSYAFGEDTIDSDVDIAIFRIKEKDLDLKKFEEGLDRKICLHFFKDWKIDKNLKSNILNGITLAGSVE